MGFGLYATDGLTYDDANRRSTFTYPNGIVATYGYDNANQVTGLVYALGQTTLGNLTYTYDAAANRTAVGGSWARTGLPQPLTSATYDVGNRIQSWAGQVFSYDLNGNLASDALTSCSWNARNQLVGLNGSTTASFAYDAFGRRRAKTVGGTTTNFLYDGLNLVQELSGSTPTANLLTGLDVDEILTRTDGSGASTLLTDALGSTLELADGSGVLQTHYTYEPFGATTPSGAASTNSIQCTGRESDLSGIYFYRARYYASNGGRFLSEDPLEFAGNGPNLYSYAGNNPIGNVDPSGCGFVDCSKAIADLAKALWNAKHDLDNLDKSGKCDAGHKRELEDRKRHLEDALKKVLKHCGNVAAAAVVAAEAAEVLAELSATLAALAAL